MLAAQPRRRFVRYRIAPGDVLAGASVALVLIPRRAGSTPKADLERSASPGWWFCTASPPSDVWPSMIVAAVTSAS